MGARVEFRLLGPLEVRRDGEVVRVGGPRQRALLALLLCNANRVVSRDRLIEELLADQPAPSPARLLRVQVSRLRKALADGEGEPRLVASSPGYRLRVEPGELDLEEFERLVATGRAALEHKDPARAVALLGDAQALWRGRPLADLEFERFARSEVQRLEELRLLALEDRIDAELALGRGGDLCAELTTITSEYPLRERLRGQLMLALYSCGRQADALAVYRQTSEMLREDLGLDPSPTLRELERSILEQDVSLEARTRVSTVNGAEVSADCPFKGLEFFDVDDAMYFFGRERIVAQLLARAVESGLVGILGPSGIGKSSLLRAGVLSALSQDALPGSADWRQLLIRLGDRPASQLTRALGGEQIEATLAQLPPGERLVIAIDQLEELFTGCGREAERAAFLEQLCVAANDDRRRALVLVALRGDFYTRFAAYPGFAALLSSQHALVGSMDRDELATAIERPAARAGLEIERSLVDALVADAAEGRGGLPLLSSMLMELWHARVGRFLSYESYRTSGGTHAAVARLAEAAYARLGESQQRIARTVLLRLAGEQEGAVVRRRAPVTELERIEGANQVVAALIDARLLTVSDGRIELSHEALLREWPRYRAWLEEDRAGRRLHAHLTAAAVEWEAHARDPGELYRGARLAAALDWGAHHSERLNELEREFLDHSRRQAECESHRQRAQNRRLRGLLLGVGALLVVAVLAGVTALLKQHSATDEAHAATAAARVALARQLGAEAVTQPRLDRAMLLAREAVNLDRSPQTEAALLATLQRAPAIIGTFVLPVGLAPQLAVSPDGDTLTVSDFLINDYGFSPPGVSLGSIRFYDPRTHAQQRAPLPNFGGARPPVFSRDGSLLVYPTDDQLPSIAARDARTLALITRLRLDPFQVATLTPDLAHASILIAPDDRTVYCAYRVYRTEDNAPNGLVNAAPAGTYLARWSLPSGRLLSSTRIDPAGILAMGMTDAGSRLLVVDAHRVSELDARSIRRMSSVAITPAPAAPLTAAISPDGRTVVVGSHTGRLSFIATRTGDTRLGDSIGGPAVKTLTYSPTGGAVVSTSADNAITVWNPSTARRTEVLTAPGEPAQDVAFSPDGTTLYTSSLSGVVLEWDLAGQRQFGRRFTVGADSSCCDAFSPLAPPLAVSPDGTRLAVRLGPATVGLFSTQTFRQQASFTVTPRDTAITALAWTPTHGELAVAAHSGVVQLWQVAGAPRLARSLTGLAPLSGQPDAVQAVAFSPDGRLLAAIDSSQTAEAPGAGDLAHYGNRLLRLGIWRTSTGQLLGPAHDLGTGPGRYSALAFSPDGKLLAVSVPDTDGDPVASDLILDPATGQVLHTLHPLGDDDTVSLAFGSDGTLATGTEGGIVQLWNPISGAQVAGPVDAADGPVTSIAFDPSNQRFATAVNDGTVKLWFTSTLQQEGATLHTAQRTASTVAFAPDGNHLLVLDDHGNASTWPMSLTAWERRACAIAGRNLTHAEWTQYLPGRSYAAVCPRARQPG